MAGLTIGILSYSLNSGGGSSVTWDPFETGTYITLTGSDLIYNLNSASHIGSVFATLGINSLSTNPKVYFEITWTAGSNSHAIGIGVCSSGINLNLVPGGDPNSWALTTNGTKAHNNSFLSSGLSSITLGGVLMCALDMTAGKVWFGLNGIWTSFSDPSTGLNETFSGLTGTIYPQGGGEITSGLTSSGTANFGALPFNYTPPPGFYHGVA